MSLSYLLLAIWLILVGLVWATVVSISNTFLGLWAIITGILLLVEQVHPISVWRNPPA